MKNEVKEKWVKIGESYWVNGTHVDECPGQVSSWAGPAYYGLGVNFWPCIIVEGKFS